MKPFEKETLTNKQKNGKKCVPSFFICIFFGQSKANGVCAYCKSDQFASVFLPRPQFSLIPFTQASTSNHEEDSSDTHRPGWASLHGNVRWSDALFSAKLWQQHCGFGDDHDRDSDDGGDAGHNAYGNEHLGIYMSN